MPGIAARVRNLTLILASALPCSQTLLAAGPSAEVQHRTRRAIVFKDGYGLVQRTTSGKTNAQGQLVTYAVPDEAVLGTLWATTPQGRLRGIDARWVESEEVVQRTLVCDAPDQVLAANEGRRATVRLVDGNTVEGTILKVLHGEQRPEPQQPSDRQSWLSAAAPAPAEISSLISQSFVLRSPAATHFILRSDQGDMLLPLSNIKGVLVDEMQFTRIERTIRKQRRKVLTFQHDLPDQEVSIDWLYFRPGFRWIPTYRIDLASDPDAEQLQIELQAEILNEAEDLIDTELEIVVGVPHFRFRDVPSPLSLEQSLRHTLQQVDPTLSNQMQISQNNAFQNSDYGVRSQEFRAASAAASATLDGDLVDLGDGLSAQGSQDLFVYQLGQKTVARGQRLTAPIFATKARFRNLFTWRLDLAAGSAAAQQSATNSPLQLAINRVWRQLVITNSTNMPWTTGPALVLQDQQPIAQELVTYTPAKNDVRVPVTVAVDVRASHQEVEVNRVASALQVGGYNYSLVDKRVTLDVCNNKSRPIPLEIRVDVPGEVTTASHQGQVALQSVPLTDGRRVNPDAAVNKQSVVVWKTELQPGETFAPVIEYGYYLRY